MDWESEEVEFRRSGGHGSQGMEFCQLSPEEDELLDMLEGRRSHDRDRFCVLVERLVERHWPDLIAHIEKRCFGGEVSAKTIAVNTFVKAIEILTQQMGQPLQTPAADSPMVYSRARCPHFLGFLKTLARWKHIDEARKARRYRTMLDTFVRQEQQRARQFGTLHLSHSEERVPLRKTDPLCDLATSLWEYVGKLPSREHLVIRLYYQHGPVPLGLQGLTDLATCAGLTAPEVRTLQRRFRKLLVGQRMKTIRHLTQDQIAMLFDVDRETVRRILTTAKQRLSADFEAERLGMDVLMLASG
jgi:RNA polymerase sigma factor (sigma-70 family)